MHDRLAGTPSHVTPNRSMVGTRVRVRDVHRAFDSGVVALAGLSVDIAPGEFLAILGPSGCGKSTLLRIIAGLDRATSGIVEVEEPEPKLDAHVTHPLGYRGSRRADIAYVFQDAHLLPWRNVLRNVALPLELMGVGRSERLDAAGQAIEQVGLTDAIMRYPNQLSGGMRMRVSLARALVTNPRLLLLDEPFAALDEITRQRLDEQLRHLWAAHGITVVFVTHSTAEAVFLAQRAVVMSRRPGRVILDKRIDLPVERSLTLRGSPEFARQTHDLYEALRGEEA